MEQQEIPTFVSDGWDEFDNETIERIVEEFNNVGHASFFIEYDHESESWVPWRGGHREEDNAN